MKNIDIESIKNEIKESNLSIGISALILKLLDGEKLESPLKAYAERFKATIKEMEAQKRFFIQIEDYVKAGVYKEKIEMAKNILQDLQRIT